MDKFNHNLDELTENEEMKSERSEAITIADMLEASGRVVRISPELWREITKDQS